MHGPLYITFYGVYEQIIPFVFSTFKFRVLSFCHVFTVYILSVYSPFSDRVGFSLHNIPFPGVLMKSIGAAFFDRMPFLMSTTCMGCNMCFVFNVNVTNSFDDRRSQCRLI